MGKELQLELQERTEEGILIFKLSGSLGVEGSSGVQGLFRACIGENLFSLILDVSDVDFISSAGMGAFLSIVGELRKNDGDIIFVNMQKKIQAVFRSLDVLDYFVTVNSIEEAQEVFRNRTSDSEKKPSKKKTSDDAKTAPRIEIDRRPTAISLLSGFADILEKASSFDDKLEQLLEYTGINLNTEILALVMVDPDSEFPSFTIGETPEITPEIRAGLFSDIIGTELIVVESMMSANRTLSEWLKENDIEIIYPLFLRGKLHSVILASIKKDGTKLLQVDHRVIRILRTMTSMIIEMWAIEFAALKSPDQESIRKVHRRLEKKLMEMETLFMISRELATTVDIDKLAPTLLVILVGQMSTDKAVLYLENPPDGFIVASARGEKEKPFEKIKLSAGKGIAHELNTSKSPLMLDLFGVLHGGETKEEVEKLMELGINLVVPMRFKDRLIGVVGLGKKVSGRDYSAEELKLLMALVNLASVSIETARLFSLMKETYSGVVRSLVSAIEAKDRFMRGHTERVTMYASIFGRELGIDDDELQALRFGAVLHDVGYIGIPDGIINNPNRLSPEDREILNKHTIIGTEIIRNIPFMSESVDIIKYHHERYDGSGYPEGLKGEDIPFNARIISICDSFDAITSDRVYRKAKTLTQAITELDKEAGKQFDPELVKRFIKLIKQHKIKILRKRKS